MKRIKESLYWIAVLISYLLAFTVFGMIIVFLLKLPPDSMFSGFVAWSLIACMVLFTADEKTLEMLKKFAKGDKE